MDAVLASGDIEARLKQTFDFSHLSDLFHSLVSTIQKQDLAIAGLVAETENLRKAHEDTHDRTKALEDAAGQIPSVDVLKETVKGIVAEELLSSTKSAEAPAPSPEVQLQPYDDSALRIDFETKIRDASLELHSRIDVVDVLKEQVAGLQSSLANQEALNADLKTRLDELNGRVLELEKPKSAEYRYTVPVNPRRQLSTLMNVIDGDATSVDGATLDEYLGAGITKSPFNPESLTEPIGEMVDAGAQTSEKHTPVNTLEQKGGVVEISESEANALMGAAREVLDIVENSLEQTFEQALGANFSGRKTPKTGRSDLSSTIPTPRVREYDSNGDAVLFPDERRDYLKDMVLNSLKNHMDLASIIMNTSKAVTPPPGEPDNRRANGLSMHQRLQNLENSINSLAVHLSEFKDKMKNVAPDNDSFAARTELAQLFAAVDAHDGLLGQLDSKAEDALGVGNELLHIADGDTGPVAKPDDRLGKMREQFRKFIGVAVDQDLMKKEIVTWRQCREMILSAIVDERVRLTVNAVDAPTVHRMLTEGIGAAEERLKKEADSQIGGFKVETNIYLNRNIDEMGKLIRDIDLRVTEDLGKAHGSIEQVSEFVKNLDVEVGSVLRPLVDSQNEKLQNLPTLSKADLDKEMRRLEKRAKKEQEEQVAKIQKVVDELHSLGTELNNRPREEQVEQMVRAIERELKFAVGHDVTQMKEVVGRVIGAVRAKVGKQDVVKMISESFVALEEQAKAEDEANTMNGSFCIGCGRGNNAAAKTMLSALHLSPTRSVLGGGGSVMSFNSEASMHEASTESIAALMSDPSAHAVINRTAGLKSLHVHTEPMAVKSVYQKPQKNVLNKEPLYRRARVANQLKEMPKVQASDSIYTIDAQGGGPSQIHVYTSSSSAKIPVQSSASLSFDLPKTRAQLSSPSTGLSPPSTQGGNAVTRLPAV